MQRLVRRRRPESFPSGFNGARTRKAGSVELNIPARENAAIVMKRYPDVSMPVTRDEVRARV
jgi:hypothetical protein